MKTAYNKSVKFLMSTLFIFFLVNPVEAGPPNNVLLTVAWDDKVTAWGGVTKSSISNIVNTAVNIVASFPPPGNTVFSWKGDRTVIQNKNVVLLLTSSSSPMVRNVFSSNGNSVERFDGDALTTTLSSQKNGVIITVMPLLDRLLFAPQIQHLPGVTVIELNRERPDALVRTIVALSHEIYGNVQADLEREFKDGLPTKPIDPIKQEVRAFQAGLDFIDRLQASEKYEKLPEKLRNDLLVARERETKTLKSYTSKLCQTELPQM